MPVYNLLVVFDDYNYTTWWGIAAVKKNILPILAMTALLAGCASNYVPPAPQPTGPASIKLAEAASSVSSSLATLEGIRKAENPQFQKKLPNANSFGMTQLSSIDWTGPIGPIVSKIAKASNYKLQVLGNQPAIPVLVTIHMQNKPLGQILQNIDYQAGRNAYIYVNAKAGIIQLRYANS